MPKSSWSLGSRHLNDSLRSGLSVADYGLIHDCFMYLQHCVKEKQETAQATELLRGVNII
eukprot:2518393-Amphidinium_carterae.1